MLKIDMEYTKGILFVRLDGNLDRKQCYKLNNYLVPVILKHKIKYLIYNMYSLKDIDSSGVDALINSKCAIKANKGRVLMCEVDKEVKKSLKRIRIKEVADEINAMSLIRL
ncbi:MAG: STAS domain-containing protein [Bacilli bacterium]|nr:STAS domain-containing protein [Bacilli bacterium]